MEYITPTNQDPSNLQLEQSAKIEKVIQKKCTRHPLKNADLLHLKSNVENTRICLSCVQQDDIPSKNYLQIKEVLLASWDSDLFSYPILVDPQLRQAMQQYSVILDFDKKQIDDFFAELTNQIQAEIDKSKQSQKLKIINLEAIQQSYLDCWKQIVNIDNLKRILYEDNNEAQLIEFINNHIQNSENNTMMIKKIQDELQTMKKKYSTEQPNKIKNLIYSFLKMINFFDTDESAPLPTPNDESNQLINELLKKQQEVDQLKKELSDCKIQIKEDQKTLLDQKQLFEELQNQNRNLLIQISEQRVKKEKKSWYNFWDKTNNQQSNNKGSQSLKSTDLLPTTKLILGNYEDSNQLSITKNNQHQLGFNSFTNAYYPGISYLNFILKPSTNYIVRVKLEQTPGQDKYFLFGLLPDSVRDATITWQLNGCLFYSEYKEGQGHLNTLLKGKAIRTDDKSLSQRSLEMRINIEKQILRVGSLPNYESVVQIDNPKEIDPATPYRFYLEGLNSKTKITIIKLEIVSEFNNRM